MQSPGVIWINHHPHPLESPVASSNINSPVAGRQHNGVNLMRIHCSSFACHTKAVFIAWEAAHLAKVIFGEGRSQVLIYPFKNISYSHSVRHNGYGTPFMKPKTKDLVVAIYPHLLHCWSDGVCIKVRFPPENGFLWIDHTSEGYRMDYIPHELGWCAWVSGAMAQVSVY